MSSLELAIHIRCMVKVALLLLVKENKECAQCYLGPKCEEKNIIYKGYNKYELCGHVWNTQILDCCY
jgi:hypothetical protein